MARGLGSSGFNPSTCTRSLGCLAPFSSGNRKASTAPGTGGSAGRTARKPDASAVTESIGRRSPWRSNSRTAVLGLTGVLVLTVIGYFIKSRIDRQRLESRLAQVSEFSDFFLNGTAYWSAPPTWLASKRKLDVTGPGIGLIKDRIFQRLQSFIRPPASQSQRGRLDCAGQG